MTEQNPWLDRDVDELELSVRSTANLQRAGITRVRELVSLSEQDLVGMKFGAPSIRELSELLGELGLSLRSP